MPPKLLVKQENTKSANKGHVPSKHEYIVGPLQHLSDFTS